MYGFLFECKKIMKKKTTIVAVILCILGAIALYILNYATAKEIENSNLEVLSSRPEAYDNFIIEVEKEKQVALEAEDKDKVAHMTKLIERYEESKKNAKAVYTAYKNHDWPIVLADELEPIQPFIDNPEEASIGFENQELSEFTIRATYEEIKILQQNNSKPFIQNTVYTPFIRTIYDDFEGSTLKKWQVETNRYAREGLSFLLQLIQMLYIPAIVIVGCFLFGNSISSEATKKQKGLNFYRVLPYTKNKLFLAKYWSGYMYVLLFSVLMLIVPVVCSFFTTGMGSFKNPVLVYEGAKNTILNDREDQFHFITMQDYLLKIALYVVVFAFFIYTFYFLCTLISKNVIVSLLFVAACTYAGQYAWESPFNPFKYTNIHQIITNETATLTFNSTYTLQTGIIVYLILGLVFLAGSYVVFGKKRIIS